MRTLETNDWILLNSIIYKIYTMENFNQMRQQFLEQIKMLIDFDSADFYLASPNGEEKLAMPVFYNCEEDLSELYDNIDYSRGILYSGKSLIYRETDIISDEARVETEYYQKVYKPNNWHYSLQMILARDKQFVGVVTFYRTIGKDNFQYDDIFLLDMLKDHLAFRLYQQKKSGDLLEEKLTVSAATEKYELTRREQTILQLLMAGKLNLEICDELTITENTLKKHILNIYRKLGIKNRVQMFKMIKEKE
ncbi:MAG: LuxR C-terminal-related transcriptional regulator [Clostridiales bacterium]|nr:LuxR C-terminal-related transcriptional regulator [Clostridiales bacterium]